MKQQRGLTLISFIIIAMIVGALFVLGMRVFPTVVEYQSIMKATKYAAMQGGTPQDIRTAFERQKTIDYFTAVDNKDLIIEQKNNNTVVSFDYVKDIPLGDMVSLRIHYTGSAKGKALN